MYKILIVDDEKWVAESIKNSIDWDKNNCTLIGIACDGIEAMEIIKK